MKQLARGRLTARLTFPSDTQITDTISTFHQCGSLKALITGQDAAPKYETLGVAVAELNLTSSGSIEYKVSVSTCVGAAYLWLLDDQ